MTISTRLTAAQYRALWTRDLERCIAVGEDHLEALVPTCPGWTVADLVDHLAGVYEHKILLLEMGKFPSRADTAAFQEPRRADPERLGRAARELMESLERREVDEVAPTFMSDDQTVGFWWRRMALETAVHRTDAERAVGERTPVDAALADDGIDELLWFATAPWSTSGDRSKWSGQTITVATGAAQWRITLGSDGLGVGTETTPSQASVGGSADALLQWAAGRSGEVLERRGDLDTVALLEAQLQGF